MNESIQERTERLLKQKKYLPAITVLQKAAIDREQKDELLGDTAECIVQELDSLPRDRRERRLYLRSLLQMVLREVPGLAAVYRDQARAASAKNDPVQDIYRNFKNWSDVVGGHKTVRDGVEDTAETVRQGFEQAEESVNNGEFAENLQGFLNIAEQGIRSGIRSLDDFFQSGKSGEHEPDDVH